MRTYTCKDCPPGLEHEAPRSGPAPERCSPHRLARDRETARDRSLAHKRNARKGRLSVVDPEQAAPDRTPVVDVLTDAEGTPAPGSVLKALRSDLGHVYSRHPAAGTLASVAEVLADVLDSPAAQIDGRIMATVAKELRGVVHELTSATAEEADDLFSDGGPALVAR